MDKEDKTWWKSILKNQKDEIDAITDEFRQFFNEYQDVTVDQLKDFVKTQAERAEGEQVKKSLKKRLTAIENIRDQNLTGEDLKSELNNLSSRFHDDLNILSDSVTKGNELLSSGFERISGVLRDSFGPIFELWDTGISAISGIYSGVMGIFQFTKALPIFLGTLKTGIKSFLMRWRTGLKEDKEQTSVLKSISNYFSRKEKREMRTGGVEEPSLIVQILKGIGILSMGIVGAFAMFAENVKKGLISGYTRIWKIFRGTFITPVVKFLSKSKLGQKVINFFTTIKNFFTGLGGRVTSFLSKFKIGRRVIGVFTKIGNFFKWILNAGTNISSLISGWAQSGGMITKIFGKIASKLVGFGSLLGKLFTPILVIYEAVKGLLSKGSIRDKILSASAGILSIWTEIPQMIINGITSLLNIDFRVDFGKKEIIKAVNRITDWTYKYITEPFLDFILIDLPGFFTNTIPNAISGVWTALKESFIGFKSILSNAFIKLKDVFMKYTPIGWAISGVQKVIDFFTGEGDKEKKDIFQSLIDKLKGIPSKIKDWITSLVPSTDNLIDKVKGIVPFWGDEKEKGKTESKVMIERKRETTLAPEAQTGGIVKKPGIVKVDPAEMIVPKNFSEKLSKLIKSDAVNSLNKAENDKRNLQYNIQKILVELKKMQDDQINKIVNQINKKSESEESRIQATGQEGPPDEIESLSLLVYNKSWGLG